MFSKQVGISQFKKMFEIYDDAEVLAMADLEEGDIQSADSIRSYEAENLMERMYVDIGKKLQEPACLTATDETGKSIVKCEDELFTEKAYLIASSWTQDITDFCHIIVFKELWMLESGELELVTAWEYEYGGIKLIYRYHEFDVLYRKDIEWTFEDLLLLLYSFNR